MTEFEQYIYNCYLETSRKSNNKPFKYRKDFTDFEDKEDFIHVSKLARLLSKFPNIQVKDFFKAPYAVYNEKIFDLKFFTTQKALKAYTIYQNKFLVDDPDKMETLLKIKESFEFIFNYCKHNKITLNMYINHIDPVKKWHEFLLHLKYRETVIYALFCFPEFDKVVALYDREIKQFTFGNMFVDLNIYRTKYYASDKAKKLCTLIYNKLNSKLQNL